MYLLLALSFIPFLLSLYALARTDALSDLALGTRVIFLASNFVPLPMVWLLAEFLRKFGKSASPFGNSQSLRLVGAGVLLLTYSTMRAFTPAIGDISIVDGTIPVSLSDAPGIGILDVTMIVFLICLAMVVRYGGALKKDSDSFI